MWILLQTVIVEDNGFNEVWAGVFTLLGAVIGVIGAVLSTWLFNRHERNLDRDRELRRWRLEQLQPTLKYVTQSLRSFTVWEEQHGKMFHTGTPDDLVRFSRAVVVEADPSQDLGFYVMTLRQGSDEVSNRLMKYLEAYHACVDDVVVAMDRNIVCRELSLPRVNILPDRENQERLLAAVIELVQTTEKHSFGVVDQSALRAVRARLAAWRSTQRKHDPQLPV